MKLRYLLWLRRISQGVFLFLFVLLLVKTRLPTQAVIDYSGVMEGRGDVAVDAPVTFFFQIDPLVWLTSLISGHTLIKGMGWAAAVLLLTLLLGRFFCGFVCPLGTLNHLAGSIRPALKGRRRREVNQPSPVRGVKYGVLAVVLVAAAAGLNLAGFVDPIAIAFRSLALAVLPAFGIGLKEIFDAMAGSDIKLLALASYAAEEIVSPVFGYGYRTYQTGWIIGLVLLLILFLNRIRPRFWCRFLCPLGALLGLVARFSPLRITTDAAACTGCGQCNKDCQGAADPLSGYDGPSEECLRCFNCAGTCPENAVRLQWRMPRAAGRKAAPDLKRRAVLAGLGAGLALPFLGRLDGRVHTVYSADLIRPPGSLPEMDFLQLCQRCGLCMKVCPTNVILPALAEAGFAGFWTPILNMNQGYCEYTCNLCAGVCPTGAIAPFTIKEKAANPIRIGSAYVDRGRCLPWSGNGPCIVCEEHCPTAPKAIYLVTAAVAGPDGVPREVQLPQVNLARCTGCGICQNKCIVRGKPAIRVISAGESRHLRNRILL